MKKKPARQPRKIEVVEDVAVATVTKPTKAKAEPKVKVAKATKAKPLPTVVTPAVVEQPAAPPEHNATVAKSAGKKGKTQSERKPEQAPIVKVEGKLQPTKLSAIDAAAKVLETSGALNCKELIEAMASGGLWTSPGGKTPHATLYAAILREITVKGNESRFVKTERGRFAKR